MSRAIVALALVLVTAALLVGLYGRFIYEPPPLATAPQFVDTDTKKPLSEAEQFEELAKTDPVGMLAQCLTRYQREVKDGLTATLVKRERPRGVPAPPAEPSEEVISLCVRGDVPDPVTQKATVEVLMKWQSGSRKVMGSEIRGTLYSQKPAPVGTGGEIRTWRPDALVSTISVAANGSSAQDSSRYCIRDGGVYGGMLRTFEAWKQRKEAGTLTTEYLGKQTIEKAGGRVCHVVKRTCKSVEVDAFELGGVADMSPENVARVGFTSVTIMIDAEKWLQVGTEIHRTGADGKPVLIGAYYFRDINLKPEFKPDTFTDAGLKRK